MIKPGHFDMRHEVRAKFVMFEVLRGLFVMHGANIIHRDLKPENILVDLGDLLQDPTATHTVRVVICDFGMARSIANVAEGEEDSSDGCSASSAYVPPPAILDRSVSTTVTSSFWRAPEMWGF